MKNKIKSVVFTRDETDICGAYIIKATITINDGIYEGLAAAETLEDIDSATKRAFDNATYFFEEKQDYE